MDYTINKLAKLSGVTIRTLRFYDEIGLLKPAYIADNGYRYYNEKQLLLLQQILFFRELGFELKHIKETLNKSDFDMVKALEMHRLVMQEKLTHVSELLKTIDVTINYLEGKQTMREQELFGGFNTEEQTAHEDYLIKRYGATMEKSIAESYKNIKHWKKADWEKAQQEFESICTDLEHAFIKKISTDDPVVQAIIARHYTWIQQFGTFDREAYSGLGQGYTEPAWEKTFASYKPGFVQFFAQAIHLFADREL